MAGLFCLKKLNAATDFIVSLLEYLSLSPHKIKRGGDTFETSLCNGWGVAYDLHDGGSLCCI